MTPDEHYDDLESLEIVELTMDLEALTRGEAKAPEERAKRIQEIRARLADFQFGGEGGDDDHLLAALVRKLGPGDPWEDRARPPARKVTKFAAAPLL